MKAEAGIELLCTMLCSTGKIAASIALHTEDEVIIGVDVILLPIARNAPIVLALFDGAEMKRFVVDATIVTVMFPDVSQQGIPAPAVVIIGAIDGLIRCTVESTGFFVLTIFR